MTTTLRAALPGLLLGLIVIAAITAATLRPHNPKLLAEVFDPRLSLGEIIDRVDAVGGQVVSTGGYHNIVIVRFQQPEAHSPQGAWLALDPIALGNCAKSLPPTNLTLPTKDI